MELERHPLVWQTGELEILNCRWQQFLVSIKALSEGVGGVGVNSGSDGCWGGLAAAGGGGGHGVGALVVGV